MNLSEVSIPDISAIEDAAERLKRFAHERGGLRTFTEIDIERTQPMRTSTGEMLGSAVYGWSRALEARWMSPYFGFGAPSRAVCRVENRPCWLNSDGIHGITNNPYLDTIDCSDMNERWKVKALILIPVHLPFGQIGEAIFCCEDNERSELSHEFETYGQELTRMATVFISDYYSLLGRPGEMVGHGKLTRRERECLTWISRGKTDEDTATIMGIGRSTVRFHIHNAIEKMNVTNRAQAVGRATQFGFLPGR